MPSSGLRLLFRALRIFVANHAPKAGRECTKQSQEVEEKCQLRNGESFKHSSCVASSRLLYLFEPPFPNL